MIDIECYIRQLIDLLARRLGSKLLYVGLQGSYLRGEATPESDIDIMVVLEELGVKELDEYRAVIQSMEHYDRSCGFICSREDLRNWNPLEMCHLLHTTKDYYGILSELIPVYTEQDIRNFVKMSINNLYHEICHRWIHADADTNKAALPGTYKGVFFILQNLYFLTHGRFVASKTELLPLLCGRNRMVLERSMQLAGGTACELTECFELLLVWCQETMKQV